jgi:hypothetical protein
MLMPLELKPPDDVADVLPQEQELTQGAIDRLRTQIDAFIEGLVAAERERMPGMPAVALRKLLMRGQCRCEAAERLIKEPQQ